MKMKSVWFLVLLGLLSLVSVFAGKNYYDILGIDRSASKVSFWWL
jgi:hypothetical protein